jgi:phospholipase/carboxylesterase
MRTPSTPAVDPKAVLWSASETDRAGRPLLVLMHGYASDETDLFGLSAYLPLEPVIASVRAPIPEGPGYAWFSRFTNDTSDPSAESADAAARAVLDWLDSLPDAPSVGLLGFSQGAAVAIQLMRLAPTRFEYAVALSGFVARGAHDSDVELVKRRPPVFWGRGTADTSVPAVSIERTEDWLPAHSTLDSRIYEGLAHSISSSELTDIAAFIRAQL